MKRTALSTGFALAVCVAVQTGSVAASEPHLLSIGSWVCASAEIHDRIVEEQRTGAAVMALRKRTEEAGECVYIDDDALEDMLQPFVTVLDRSGGHARVNFILEHYRRLAMLHRKFSRMEYTGWTKESNVAPR